MRDTMNSKPKSGNYKFKLISIDRYIKEHKKHNPDVDAIELRKDLIYFKQLSTKGIKCSCGNDLWVIGSAISGKGCFTCITMETDCSEDFDIE